MSLGSSPSAQAIRDIYSNIVHIVSQKGIIGMRRGRSLWPQSRELSSSVNLTFHSYETLGKKNSPLC